MRGYVRALHVRAGIARWLEPFALPLATSPGDCFQDPFPKSRVPPLGQTERARSIYLAVWRVVPCGGQKISSLSPFYGGQLLLESIRSIRNESTAVNCFTAGRSFFGCPPLILGNCIVCKMVRPGRWFLLLRTAVMACYYL